MFQYLAKCQKWKIQEAIKAAILDFEFVTMVTADNYVMIA